MQAIKMSLAAGKNRQSEQSCASHNIMNDFSDVNDQSPILPQSAQAAQAAEEEKKNQCEKWRAYSADDGQISAD